MRRTKVWLLILLIVLVSASFAHASRCQNRGRRLHGERGFFAHLRDSR